MFTESHQYGMVNKVSVSDMDAAVDFYCKKLGGCLDPRYTISKAVQPNQTAYAQILFHLMGNTTMAFGLFNDINHPFDHNVHTEQGKGTVPTFIVRDIELTISMLRAKDIECSDVISNTSDQGYTDHFAFFNDPDNNILGIRQNFPPKFTE
jgi:catechol 2,3-dioxygenase-like lactoylglutathione lyase family enzyme